MKELNDLLEKLNIPGFAMRVFDTKGNDNIFEYGYSDIKNQKKFTVSTVMNIGSLSKLFIGTAFTKIIKENSIDTEEDINKILPFRVRNPYFKNAVITMKNLYTHTSSVKDNLSIYNKKCYITPEEKTETIGEFLYGYLNPEGKLYSENNFLNKKPGESYCYSNIGACIAAYITECITGISYAEYTEKKIFKKLGMNSTSWEYDVNIDNSQIYSRLRIDFAKKSYFSWFTKKPLSRYKLLTYPDGGLRTNINDMSLFFKAVMERDNRIMKEEEYNFMIKKQFEKYKPKELLQKNTGVFWEFTSKNSLGHSGDDPGIHTSAFITESGKASIIFMNTDFETLGKNKFLKLYNEIKKCI